MLSPRLKKLPYHVLRPLPTAAYQPVLQKIVAHVADIHPDLFSRLGPHCNSTYLIDPTNLPFVIVLRPSPDKPRIHVHRRRDQESADACITGSFVNLLRLIDGTTDGDALFFSRDLGVTGNTEAIVCLRNALDDVEGSIADDIARYLGPPGRYGLKLLRKIRA